VSRRAGDCLVVQLSCIALVLFIRETSSPIRYVEMAGAGHELLIFLLFLFQFFLFLDIKFRFLLLFLVSFILLTHVCVSFLIGS
jgi:hypothetical protein